MRKFIIILVLILVFLCPVGAEEIMQEQADQFGASALEDQLPSAAQDILDDASPIEQLDLTSKITEIFGSAISNSRWFLRTAGALMLRILLIIILCRLVEDWRGPETGRVASLAGTLAIVACCAADVKGMVGLGQQTMEEVLNFSGLLIPVMASAAAASGALTASGGLYAVTTVFSNILIRFCTWFLIPGVYGMLALAMTDSALGQDRLKKLRDLVSWAVKTALKGVMYVFTGFLTMTGVLSGASDAAALKAAKATISTMVPVVGGIVSNAAQTVLSGAGLLKSTIGTYGTIAVLAVFALPFLRMGVQFLAFKVTSALSGVMGSSLCGILDAISDAMGLLLAMTGGAMVMSLLSCFCLLKAGGS